MKNFLLLMALSIILSVGTAHADSVSLAGAGGANDFTNGVYEMDWSSSGSGLATDIGPFGTALAVDDTFSFLFQASLTGLSDEAGNAMEFAGLGSTFEYTVVARFEEKVVDVTTNGLGQTTATFATTGGSWYMYYDKPNDSVTSTGLGFDDGTLVLSGSVLAGNYSTFTATSASAGLGIHNLMVSVDTIDENYITTGSSDLTLFAFDFEGTQNYPAGNSTTESFFFDADGGDDEGNLTGYTVQNDGQTPDDILFKADSSSNFHVVPEPSTMLLLGLGLISLGGVARRKRIS